MEIFGIKFAPINVPMERRLQSLAAATWFVTLAFGWIVGWGFALYLLVAASWPVWWATVAYLTWVFLVDSDTPEKGGRPSKWVQSWAWWRYMRDYFPVKLERAAWVELDPKKNYLFCSFPHGMLAAGSFASFMSNCCGFNELFPHHQSRVIILGQHFKVPFLRELTLAMRAISASAKSINYLLSYPGGGMVTVLLVGGAAEAYYCKPGQYKLVLKNRKGFVKLALKNGAPLVPVLSFGETDLFDQLGSDGSTIRKVQEAIRRWIGLAPVLMVGRGFFQYSFGLMPRRKPVTTVVGMPLEVPKIEEPTKEQIGEYHGKFVDHLIKMFEEQKYNYLENPQETHLIIC